MKAQIAISLLLMANCTTAAFAQDVKIDLPKRERNLDNWYRDPAQIQVFQNSPTVHVFPGRQPGNSLYIRVPNVRGHQPGKSVVVVPASEFEPSSMGNPKIGNFESNTPVSGFVPSNLPPGQTSRVLQPGYFTPKKAKPVVLAKSAPASASGNSRQDASTSTDLRYTASSYPPSASGSDIFNVKTKVTGTFKPGDLINAKK
jgi:hypothetical protein